MKTNKPQKNILEGWNLLPAGDVFTFVKSYAFSRDNLVNDTHNTDGIGNIHYGDIHSSFSAPSIDLKKVSVPMVKDASFAPKPEDLLKDGDLIMADASEDYAGIGVTVSLHGLEDKKVVGGLHTFVLRDTKNKTDKYFRQYIFRNPEIRNEMQKIANGVSVYGVSKTSVAKLLLPIPSLTEQKRIVSVLETWDEATVHLSNKLEIKKKLKRALSQKLLTGDIRLQGFTEEWKIHPLSFYVEYCPRPVEKPTGKFTAIGIRSHCKGTFRKENFDPNSIDMDTLYELRENDLVVNITFAWEGAIAIVGKDGSDGLVSHRFPTYTFKDKVGSPEYFKQFIQSKNFRYQLKIISPGGAGRNRVLSKKDFVKLKIKIPDYKEQCAIGNILTTADKEIAELETKLALLTDQKNYLLNNLITGTIRTPEKLSTHN